MNKVTNIKIGKYEYHLTDGRVGWANTDGWADIYKNAKAGYFKIISGGPGTFGHDDFYYTGKEGEGEN